MPASSIASRISCDVAPRANVARSSSPEVACLLAVVAARSRRRWNRFHLVLLTEGAGLEVVVHAPAVHAQAANQPLREHRRQAVGDLERLEAEVHQTRHRARGVGRVERAQDEMPGIRRLSHNLRDLGIANLADHDHVGILAQDRSQDGRERVAGAAVDRYLRNARHRALHGILDADDVGLS